MSRFIKTVIKEPGRNPFVSYPKNTKINLANIVGKKRAPDGRWLLTPDGDMLVILHDDQAKAKGEPFNCTVHKQEFYGTIIFCGARWDTGEYSDIAISWKNFKDTYLSLFGGDSS